MNGRDDIMTLLADSGDVGANGSKGLGALLSAEGAGYFLFDLDHTDVAFRRVITLVAGLSAQRSLPWLAHTAGAPLLQSITARWLAAVTAVFGQLVPQHLNQHALDSQLLLQRQQQVDQAGFVQLLQLMAVKTNRLCHAPQLTLVDLSR